MALGYSIPNAVGLNPFQWGGTWADVDDGWVDIDTVPTAHDGDSTFISTQFTATRIRFNCTDWSYTSATISQVEVVMVIKGTSTALSLTPYLYLGTSTQDGSSQATPTSYGTYTQTIARPGGGSWTVSDIDSLQVGLLSGGTYGKADNVYCTQLYLRVTYTIPSGHPPPSSLECDYQTNPTTGVSEYPNFTAIAETTASETLTSAYIEVYEDSGMTTQVADSGWLDIDDVTDGVRSEVIDWDGNGGWVQADYLKSDHTYHWRIKFREAAKVATLPLLFNRKEASGGVESIFNTTLATFSSTPLKRQWHLPSYTHRKLLKFNDDHAASGAGLVIPLEVQTGLRESITDTATFNESIGTSGGFQLESYDGKSHLVYSSKPTTGRYFYIYIMSRNDTTEVWGEPVLIHEQSTVDTHLFPVLSIDGAGYIHVVVSGHNSSINSYVSDNSNDTGSLSGETGGFTNTSIGVSGTYPIAFYVASKDRTYVIWRESISNWQYGMIWTDDKGATWSTPYDIIDDQHGDQFRVYLYGLRYDNIDDRLHISFTYNHDFDDGDTVANNEVSLGVWYAYSDLDETWSGSYTNEGFNVWREADGSIIGLTGTDPIGNGHATSTDWDLTTAQAIVYAPDEESHGFTISMVLDRFRKPVVFWEQKIRVGLPTVPFHPSQEWTDLCCATYSADIGFNGTWSKNYVSEQINEMLRVRRTGASLMTDIDGIIHCRFTVGSISYWRTLPTADVDSIGVIRSSGSDNYALLDDGMVFCDPSEYVIINATTGQISFTHSGTIDTNYTITDVEIEFTAKRTSSPDSTTFTGFVEIDGTEYNDATTQTVANDIYYWYKFNWLTNPATASAWTNDEVDGLTFGIKNTGANLATVCRCVLRVKYTESSNAEYVSNEIVYATSYDDGVTWKKVSKSLNSSKGMSQMSHAHRLTVDEVAQVCWTTGFDIFYMDNKSGTFSEVRSDCKDLRLYCGDTEIDRVLDYADKNPTEVKLKLQESILVDAVWSTKDYILYYGNPNETTNALSDPHNIYKYFNGWEQYEDGDVITDEWTVNSGSPIIYGSPPDNFNKVFGGNSSLEFPLSAEVEKTILSAEQNVFIEFAIFVEAASIAILKIEDASANQIGVGYTSDYAGIWNGTSYLDANGTSLEGFRPISQSQLTEYKMLLNSSGLTAWCNGTELCRDYAVTPTTVDKILLYANNQSWFDFIRVSNSYEASSDVTKYADTWSYPALEFVSDADRILQGDTIADANIFDLRDENITSLTATEITIEIDAQQGVPIAAGSFWCRLWISKGATYDPSKLVTLDPSGGLDYLTLEIPYLTSDGYVNGTFDKAILGGGTYSVLVQFYLDDGPVDHTATRLAQSYAVLTQVNVFNPELEVHSTEIKGVKFLNKLVGRGKTRFYYKYDISGTKVGWVQEFPVDSSGYIDDAVQDFNVAYTSNVEDTTELPVDYIGVIENIADFVIEVLGDVANPVHLPIEHTKNIEEVQVMPVEYGKLRELTTELPVSHIGFFADDNHLVIDFTATVNETQEALIEYNRFREQVTELPVSYTAQIHSDAVLPVSFKGAIETVSVLPVEIQQLLDEATTEAPIEYTVASESIVSAFPVDITQFASSDNHFPIDYVGTVSEIAVNVFPIDYTVNFVNPQALNVDFTQTTTMARYLNVSYQSKAQAETSLNVDWTALLTSDVAFPVSYTTKTGNIVTSIPIAYKHGLDIIRTMPVSYKGAFTDVRTTPISYKAGLTTETELPIGWTTGAAFELASEFPISYTMNRQATHHHPIEINSSLNIINTSDFPVDFLGSPRFEVDFNISINANRTADVDFNIENNTFLSAETDLNVDYLLAFMQESGIPLEYLGSLILAIVINNLDIKKAQLSSMDMKIMSTVTDLLKPRISGIDLLIPATDIEISKTKIVTPNIKGGNAN